MKISQKKMTSAKKNHIKGTQIFHNTENTKDKILERSMTIPQSIEKMPTLYYKFHDEKMAIVVQTALC